MKDYRRKHPEFALCGLNCLLCVMHVDGYCPGCGGGEGHQGCAVIRCARERGVEEFCTACADFPCARLTEAQRYDSFIAGGQRARDALCAREQGMGAYLAALRRKRAALDHLLAEYNDGRHKRFFALAVNLLPVDEVESALAELPDLPQGDGRERARAAEQALRRRAEALGIALRLRRRPGGRA